MISPPYFSVFDEMILSTLIRSIARHWREATPMRSIARRWMQGRTFFPDKLKVVFIFLFTESGY